MRHTQIAAGLVSIAALALGGTVEAAPWTFVSTPDFVNVDVGDLNTYTGPPHGTPFGNSYNASWEHALGYFLDGIAAEDPDFVAVAGDLVMARWYKDAWKHGVFEQLFASEAERDALTTLMIEQNRVINASNFYYDALKQRFQDRLLPLYAAVGDHELGDNPSWDDLYGNQTVTTYRSQFAQHFVEPFTSSPSTSLAPDSTLYSQPAGGQQAETAYAIRHRNLLLITVDTFEQREDGVVLRTIEDEQLDWLEQTIAAAEADPSIDHIIVQGHCPTLTPLAMRVSSGLTINGGPTRTSGRR